MVWAVAGVLAVVVLYFANKAPSGAPPTPLSPPDVVPTSGGGIPSPATSVAPPMTAKQNQVAIASNAPHVGSKLPVFRPAIQTLERSVFMTTPGAGLVDGGAELPFRPTPAPVSTTVPSTGGTLFGRKPGTVKI